ncbi:MAG: response regulator [Lachnospiraceae bacterium]|nr:response regulator [Lachnospiraceae bacterium]
MSEKTKILIVDDVEASRVALRTALGETHVFYEAVDGRAAWDILEDDSAVDLILLDLIMPELPGIQLLKKIKADQRFEQIPIIVCTADDEEKTEEEALKLGAEDFLTKPFKPAVVRQRVENTLRRRYLEHQIQQVQINQKVQELMDNLPVGIGILEIDQKEMRPTCVNKKAMELFEINHSLSQLRDKDAAFIELNRHDLDRIMSEGKEKVSCHVYTVRRKDGTSFKIQAIARLCPNEDGTMTCYAASTEILEDQ